ncbi:glycosylphosphatidylinositol anchor biosynthesis [Cerrena zonata]|uniref:Glycosylphosphatidylinositol anchor biosynthesis n=1 Tax=Cerrena zonata TaxID=2478898 RepID=A0AAW0G7P7_9APHY
MANALGMYRTVKRLGIPDSNIILMLADDAACNSRNKFPGCVYPAAARDLDLYGDNIEVDYRGYEVTVENFIRVLTGRMDSSVPRSKRLLSDDRSNVFVYMTGHGGNEFLKFQDNEEISAFDIADAFEQMWQKKRYNEIFFMIDTCQANTMYSKFYSPNILATGSSKLDENSYSYENDMDLGISVIDRFTHYVLRFMESVNKTSQATMQDLFDMYDPDKFASHAGVRSDLFNRPIDQTLITDFFGGVSQAEVLAPEEEFYYSSTPEGGHQQESESFTHVDSATTSGAVKSNNDEIHGYSDLLSVVQDLQREPPKRDTTGLFRTWVSSGLMFALVAWVSMRK